MLVTDPTSPALPQDSASGRIAVLRHAHGWGAATILVVFLGAHLINHLLALAGADVHVATMKMLRHLYSKFGGHRTTSPSGPYNRRA